MKQMKSFLKLFTSTYRTAKDFKHLPVGDTIVSSNQIKSELVMYEVSIFLPTILSEIIK